MTTIMVDEVVWTVKPGYSIKGLPRILEKYKDQVENMSFELQMAEETGFADTLRLVLNRPETLAESRKRVLQERAAEQNQRTMELSQLKILMKKYPPEERM